MRERAALLAVVGAIAAGAAWAAAPGAPPPPDVLATQDLGPLETNPIISGRDGAYSTRVGGTSVWVYGDTALTSPGADGGTWRHNTLSWTHDLYATDGITGFSDWADSIGAPIQFLPLTQDEIDYNALHHGDNCQVPPCNYEYGLWPGALVFDPDGGRVLYTYAKMLLGPGAWNFSTIGSGIAVGPEMPAGNVVRPVVDPTSTDPTLLFHQGEPVFLNAAFVERIGNVPYVYFYDCSGGDGFTKPMHVARVPVASVLDRSTWRFYAGSDTWSASVTDAAVIFDGSDQLSVHYSPFLGRYLAIYLQPLSTNAVARVADHPEGPWSDPILMFNALRPYNGGLDYCGMAHLEFQQDGGRIEYVGYVHDLAPFQAERRIVEVEFARRPESDDRDADYDPQHGVQLSDAVNTGQVCMGNEGALWRQMALQFPMNLPRPSTITSASVRLVSSGNNAGSYTPVLRAIAQDDVAPFTAGSMVPFTDAYPLTSASAAWTPDNVLAGLSVETPDLTPLIQEVVDRPGWLAGSHIGIVFPETQKGHNIRCFEDESTAPTQAAALRVGYYADGTAVCLDATGGDDRLLVTREPAGGCASAPAGPQREFVFGRLGALRVAGSSIDLGPVRCAGGADPTTLEIVRAADPEQPPDDGSFYLSRPAGAPGFGTALLPDGSTPARLPGPSFCP